MDYRKKNTRPKPHLATDMIDSLSNEPLMDSIDFFQQLRKQGFLAQNEKGIKCHKNCHLTSEGLELHLRDSLNSFLAIQHEKASNKYNPKEILKK